MLFIYLATLITNLTPMQDRWRAKLKSLAFKSSAIVVLPLASDTPFRILVFEDFSFFEVSSCENFYYGYRFKRPFSTRLQNKKRKQLQDCIIKAKCTVGARKQSFQPSNLIIFCIHIQ